MANTPCSYGCGMDVVLECYHCLRQRAASINYCWKHIPPRNRAEKKEFRIYLYGRFMATTPYLLIHGRYHSLKARVRYLFDIIGLYRRIYGEGGIHHPTLTEIWS